MLIQPFYPMLHGRGGYPDAAIFRQESQPVQDRVLLRVQIQNSQLGRVDLVAVDKPVSVFPAGPLLGEVEVFGALEPPSVIIIRLALAIFRYLHDLRGSVIKNQVAHVGLAYTPVELSLQDNIHP